MFHLTVDRFKKWFQPVSDFFSLLHVSLVSEADSSFCCAQIDLQRLFLVKMEENMEKLSSPSFDSAAQRQSKNKEAPILRLQV